MKLLIDAPTGQQELIEIGEGGGYFDPSRVLWDERTDGPLPEITLGGVVRVGNTLVFNQSRMEEHTASTRPPIPQAVTMRQARLALLAAGKLAAVSSAIAGMTGAEGDAARIEWEFSSEVKRNQPLVTSLGKVLGLTAVQLDNLFVTASTL